MMLFRTIVMLLGLAIAYGLQSEDLPENESRMEFEEARKVVEENCPTCFGASMEALIQGIVALERIAEETNDGDVRRISLELLGDAYGGLAFGYQEEGSDERAHFARKQLEAYQKLASGPCFDPAAQLKLAIVQSSGPARLETLKAVLNLQPILFEAKYIEAMELLANGAVESGLEALSVAVALASDGQKIVYGPRMAAELSNHGREEAAKALKAEILNLK